MPTSDQSTITTFRTLEAQGRVRLRTAEDTDYEWNATDPEEYEKFGHDGVWGSLVEVRPDTDSDPNDDASWEQVDSCWGHVGYLNVLDPKENPYIVDHMRVAIDAVEAHDERARFASVPCGAD